MAFTDPEAKTQEKGNSNRTQSTKRTSEKWRNKECYIVNNNVNEKDTDEQWKDKSIYKKYLYLKSLITVEPILAFYVMPSVLSALATQNLYLEKACRVNLKYSEEVCDALTKRNTANFTHEEGEVQRLVASVAGWKTVLQSFLPCAIILFLGAYSDSIGKRKFCMLLPIVGEFLTSVGLALNTYYFYELPLEVAAVTEAIFPALTGGWFTMFMGVFSYIADVTTEEQRTVRIGVVNMFYSLGVPIGSALSGILVREIGFYGVFSLSASLYVLSFLYGYYMVDEIRKPVPNVKKASSCCEWLNSFFDIRLVKETVLVAFKQGPNNRRLRVSMLLIVLCVVIGPIYGEMAVMYLFTRFRFNWDEVDFSVFSTYSMCTSLVGTLFSVGVFSHTMKLDDAIVGAISCTSKILSAFMYAFASNKWQIYIAPLIEIFNGTSFIAMRSMVSKLVSSDELGKVNSLFGVAEAMMPLVYAPMYTTLYTSTLDSFPGAFFLLGAFLTFPAVLIFAWLYIANKKEIKSVADEKASKIKDKLNDPTVGVVNTAFENEERGEIIKTAAQNEEKEENFKTTKENINVEGVVNKAFENESNPTHVAANDKQRESALESEVEMGITVAIHATSKM